MDYPLTVRIFEGGKGLADVRNPGRSRDLTLAKFFFETLAFHQFHDQHLRAVQEQCIVDSGNVGVVKPGLRLDFPLETLDLDFGGAVAYLDLQGLSTLGKAVFHLEDLTHASSADDGDDPIISNVFANM